MAKFVPVILGPTGSGKTGVGIEIARELSGEVISADSRAIYKYMDIGTAKPSTEEGALIGDASAGKDGVKPVVVVDGVLHWGIDLVEPGERFTVADWKQYAEQKIAEISQRGHLPIVVGGTGLYIDALVFNYQFRGVTRVKNLCKMQTRYAEPVDRQEMSKKFRLYGIKWDRDKLRERLYLRANKLFNDKLYAETEFLVQHYGWGSQAMTSNIYRFAWDYMQGECAREEAIMKNVYADYHLAKRQMTWFQRNKEIKWLPLDRVRTTVIQDFVQYQ